MFHPLSELTLLPLMPDCIILFASVRPFISLPCPSAMLLSCIFSPELEWSFIVFVDPFFVVFKEKFTWNMTLDRKHCSFTEPGAGGEPYCGGAVPQRRTFVRSTLAQSIEGVRQRWVTPQQLDARSALLTTVVTTWLSFRVYERCQQPYCGLRFGHRVIL